jgi:hypothetical protein
LPRIQNVGKLRAIPLQGRSDDTNHTVRNASIAADAASAVLKKRPQSTDVRAEKTEAHTHTHTHTHTQPNSQEGGRRLSEVRLEVVTCRANFAASKSVSSSIFNVPRLPGTLRRYRHTLACYHQTCCGCCGYCGGRMAQVQAPSSGRCSPLRLVIMLGHSAGNCFS